MIVSADRFFPADLARTRKFFKLLLNDPEWDRYQIDELLDYFANRQQETEAKAERLQLCADRQKEVADALKAHKPKRNTPEYAEYVKEKEKAYQMGVTARATAREVEGLKRTRLMLMEMDGRTV